MRRMVALLLAVGLLGAIVPTAAATTTKSVAAHGWQVYESTIVPASDPGAAYAALSPEDQADVDLALTPVSFGEDRGPVTQVSGPKVTSTAPDALVGAALTTSQCWQVTIARYGTNILGAKLYQLNLWSKWCSNSNKMSLTEWYYRVYPSDMAILWFYVTGGGYPDVHAYGGPPTFSGEFWAMGRFQYCLAGVQGIGCIQEKYPWLDIGFRANGVWWWSSGG
jgi:hypothetical protein